MQVVPWLGVVPNKDGQLQQLLCDDNYSPVVSLFKEATGEVLYSTSRVNCPAFLSMAKQAEVVGTLLCPGSIHAPVEENYLSLTTSNILNK